MTHHQSIYRISPQLKFPIDSDELIVDSFCGGGGASLGIEQAIGRPVDIAINHDPQAISMHTVNHPATKHYNESVWDVCPREATAGRRVGLGWFSPDCTHFSKAKGGRPVKKSIRGLAWIVVKWAALTKLRIIHLENVEEFLTWGPLDKHGKPIKSRAGETFEKWKVRLERLGYQVEHRVLRCSDYGVATTRKRLFLIARNDGEPIVWPEQTHSPKGRNFIKHKSTGENVIDWAIPCPSIFERKRPLAENTMIRIAKGIEKFVINSANPFIVRIGQTGWGGDGMQYDLDQPLTTITTKAEHCLVAPILDRQFGKSRGASVAEPLPTITSGGGGKSALVAAFLGRHKFMNAGCDLHDPLPTVTAGGAYRRPAGSPHSLALQTAHIIKFRGDNIGSSAHDPLHTISAQGNHHGEVRAFLLKYYGSKKGGCDLNNPLDTVTTKERFGIVLVEGVEYQIIDIGMRMLQPHELYRAHGFPTDYIFTHNAKGEPFTKSQQVAKCGNSVPPQMAKVLVAANYTTQQQTRKSNHA